MRLASCCSLARFKPHCTRKGPRDATAEPKAHIYLKTGDFCTLDRDECRRRQKFGQILTHRLDLLSGAPPTPWQGAVTIKPQPRTAIIADRNLFRKGLHDRDTR